MRASSTLLPLAALALALNGGPAAAQTAGYQGYVGYKIYNIALSRDQCLDAAGRIMRELNYIVDPIGAGESALWAGRNNEVVLTVCAVPGNLITVFVHSPNAAEPPGLFQRLENGLRAAANVTAPLRPTPPSAPSYAPPVKR